MDRQIADGINRTRHPPVAPRGTSRADRQQVRTARHAAASRFFDSWPERIFRVTCGNVHISSKHLSNIKRLTFLFQLDNIFLVNENKTCTLFVFASLSAV
jgi:hypothetical protein